ncbi:MarR family winged helix-turn-helix transcriptional regulator [Methanolobus profundi]|uniref:DNA-binding transcriptional regulator, MarR family n=1 Tax=Methanolobus profundi TaxID=487685 RepID=A0A1I4PPK0_9EURY|nr:MarR family winged helix-turn-helix transcriptional regulator [Methanolobus profundi]SFM29305.1 DNA-binding transcriptional regulator, MarR family [Methanolobus profundi]
MEEKEQLFTVFEKLLNIKNQCSSDVLCECGSPDITIKQVRYLQVIDEHGEITFSRLAEITRNSKPTISEMINKFIRMEYVYKKRSPVDGRTYYICLTDKGQTICRREQIALLKLTERMAFSLDENEMSTLIGILGKVR